MRLSTSVHWSQVRQQEAQLMNSASNRYSMVLKVVKSAHTYRSHYDEEMDEPVLKPVIQALMEMNPDERESPSPTATSPGRSLESGVRESYLPSARDFL